ARYQRKSVGLQRVAVCANRRAGLRIELECRYRRRAARQCLETEHAAAGKEIETVGADDRRLQPVEQRFAHTVGCWSQARCVGEDDDSAAPVAADDAQPVAGLGIHARALCLPACRNTKPVLALALVSSCVFLPMFGFGKSPKNDTEQVAEA